MLYLMNRGAVLESLTHLAPQMAALYMEFFGQGSATSDPYCHVLRLDESVSMGHLSVKRLLLHFTHLG